MPSASEVHCVHCTEFCGINASLIDIENEPWLSDAGFPGDQAAMVAAESRGGAF